MWFEGLGGRVNYAVVKSILFCRLGMPPHVPNCYVAETYAMNFLPESLMGMANRLSVTFFLQIHHKQAPPLESHIWSQRIRHANGGGQAQAFSGPFTHHEPSELWGEGDPPV